MTAAAIPFDYWQKRYRRVSSTLSSDFGDPAELNQKLLKMVRSTQKLINLAEQKEIDVSDFLKKPFRPELTDKPLDGERLMAEKIKREMEALEFPRVIHFF